jgi:DnaJ family protein B protein 12
MSGKTSGSDAKSRDHHDGSAGRAFTVEQKAAVIRIKSCAPTAYYKILGLEEVKTSCSDSDIKKAYRKLSLLTHPDKNGYDGADDAFKLVAKAFQVLSDPDKKKKYDQFGLDPDARFDPRSAAGAGGGGGGASPFGNGFARGGQGFGGEEMTPEELFRQFFGGAFGGPFGTFTAVYDVDRGTWYYGGMLTSKQAAWTQDPASSSTLAAAQEYASTSSAADAPDDVPKPHSLRAPTDPKT